MDQQVEIKAFMDKAQAIAKASAEEKDYNQFSQAYEYGFTLSYMAGVLTRLNLTKKQMDILRAYE